MKRKMSQELRIYEIETSPDINDDLSGSGYLRVSHGPEIAARPGGMTRRPSVSDKKWIVTDIRRDKLRLLEDLI